jgi:aminoglycoside phosphotransferase (APT) family kinase protein
MEVPVKEVIVTIDGRHGGKFSVVQFEDGEYGVTRDGTTLTRCGNDLKKCLRTLQSLAGIDGAEHG